MKLIIILLCIASERYLLHTAAQYRYQWFFSYSNYFIQYFPKSGGLLSSYSACAFILLPILVLVFILFWLLQTFLYGIFSFILALLIFYFCLGPENPFYPLGQEEGDLEKEEAVQNYFVQVNHQLFAVITWFILAGPLLILLYRLLTLCKEKEVTAVAANQMIACLDWVSARITVLLYLLVGNFQRGFQLYSKYFFTSPANNELLLKQGGLLSATSKTEEAVSLPYAQILVEHALVVYLVFLALFTLAAWL